MANVAENSYTNMHRCSSKQENEFNLCKSIYNARILDEKPDVFQMYLNFECPTNILKPFILDKRLDNEIMLKDLYKESLIAYKNILKLYKDLAIYFRINDSLQLSQFLSLLLWCGFFSPTGVHTYKLDNRFYLDGMYSFDVFNGGGVCVAYSQLLEDFLREYNFKAASIGCREKRNDQTTSFSYQPPIIRNFDISESESLFDNFIQNFISILCNNKCNHAVTLINDEKGMYLYDATNLCALNLISTKTANGVTYNGSMEFYPDDSLFYLSNIDSYELLENLAASSNKEIKSKRRIITQDEFISLFEDMITKFMSNLRIVQDAYHENYANISTIYNQINTYGDCKNSIKTYKKMKKTTE